MEEKKNEMQQGQPVEKKKKSWVKTALIVTIVAATGFWLGKRGVKGACEDVKSIGTKAKGLIPGGHKNNDECVCEECEVDKEPVHEQRRENSNGRNGHLDRRPKFNN